jgi:hypothetical protein
MRAAVFHANLAVYALTDSVAGGASGQKSGDGSGNGSDASTYCPADSRQ